jgi:cobalt-zinc-cadmium efflux system protein
MAHDHRAPPPRRQTAAARSRSALAVTAALTGSFLVVEVVAAFWTGSLALMADAGHMLADVGGLTLALFAIWIAGRPPTPEKTYGFYRVEILAALANGILVLAVALTIMIEAYRRFLDPPEILGLPMLTVAAAGFMVNVAGAWLLHPGARESLNVRAAYVEVLSDALTSLGVVAAALTVLMTGWRAADPLVSAAIAVFIVPRTWRLLRQAVNILLEGTPPHLDLRQIQGAMEEVSGVRRVHDLHVWTLTSGREAMSAHVVVDDLAGGEQMLDRLHALLHSCFGIDHTTIQLETEPPAVLTIRAAPEDRTAQEGKQ